MFSVMNNSKWEALRLEMYELKVSSPRWRTKDLDTGYVSPWDGDWFYHFNDGQGNVLHPIAISFLNQVDDTIRVHKLRNVFAVGHIDNPFSIQKIFVNGQKGMAWEEAFGRHAGVARLVWIDKNSS